MYCVLILSTVTNTNISHFLNIFYSFHFCFFVFPVELDITPTLSKLNGDPKKVKEITKNIKDLVKLLAVVLAGSRSGQTLDYIEYNTTFLRRYSMVSTSTDNYTTYK